eukprot:5792490-Amphidinium_carterae.1
MVSFADARCQKWEREFKSAQFDATWRYRKSKIGPGDITFKQGSTSEKNRKGFPKPNGDIE